MNEIEEAARQALSALVRGERQELETGDVQAIATWTVKTILMAQLTGAEGIAALGNVYRTFYVERKPPQNSVAWVAASGGEDWGVRSEIVSALIATEEESGTVMANDPVNTISATLGRGFLLLHTVITARPSVSYPPLDEIHSGSVVRLWPNPTALTLPPPHWLVNEAAWALSRSFAYWVSSD
jgi:hypothetical protein